MSKDQTRILIISFQANRSLEKVGIGPFFRSMIFVNSSRPPVGQQEWLWSHQSVIDIEVHTVAAPIVTS